MSDRTEGAAATSQFVSAEVGRLLDACVSALMSRARQLPDRAPPRRFFETSAEVCVTTSLALGVADLWPELTIAQARAAYEATRLCAGEGAKDEASASIVAPCAEARDELKRLLGALESTTGVAPLVHERDLPRRDAGDPA